MTPDERTFYTALGRNIRRRRRLLNLTQVELASMVGVRFQQLQKYECGANRILTYKLTLIAGALGCSVVDLLPVVLESARNTRQTCRGDACGATLTEREHW